MAHWEASRVVSLKSQPSSLVSVNIMIMNTGTLYPEDARFVREILDIFKQYDPGPEKEID